MKRWPRAVSVLVSLALPVVILAVALRVVTAPWLVRWEYGKPDFPPDPYGLTTEERIRLAEVCVEYLATGAGIELLADLELEGRPAFNERELAHMVDVQRVFWAILRAGHSGSTGPVPGRNGSREPGRGRRRSIRRSSVRSSAARGPVLPPPGRPGPPAGPATEQGMRESASVPRRSSPQQSRRAT